MITSITAESIGQRGSLGTEKASPSPLPKATDHLELQQRRGAAMKASESLDDPGVARLDFELMKLGHPGWSEAPAQFSGDTYAVPEESIPRRYALALERRTWLLSSESAMRGELGHGWRFVVGPTDSGGHEAGPIRGEVVIPARTVIVSDKAVYDEDDARAEAWWTLTDEAIRAGFAGLDPAEVLGLTLATCEREYAAAAGRVGISDPRDQFPRLYGEQATREVSS